MFVTNWISTTKIQKISEITNFFRHYFLSRTEVLASTILSMTLLAKAVQTLPLGTAYAIWTGIGAVGTVLIGIFVFKEPATPIRLFFLFTLIASLIGLKIVSY